MKQTLISLLFGSMIFSACQKNNDFAPQADLAETCHTPVDNPLGRSYSSNSIVTVNYNKKICGLLPLGKENYWVYRDSLFNNGSFIQVQYDTLRFTSTFRSLTDSLIWWQSNISVGLPERLYTTDSSLFEMENRYFYPGMVDVTKGYSLFAGDSVHYLSNFEDNAAMGRSVKIKEAVTTSAGNFYDCIYFEKNARNYRLDQVYFKPGLGVIKYIKKQASPGSSEVTLQQVSTLVTFHFE